MCFKPPDRQLSDVRLFFPKEKEQVGHPLIPENRHIIQPFPFGKDPFLLFFFGEEKLDMGKLAAWRLKTRYQFGSTWMSDYVDNRLGGFLHEAVAERPDCALIGEDGNIFNLMGIAARTLRENGMEDKAEEMEKRITGGGCQDYYEALNIIDQYVTITGKEEPEMGGMEMK